LKTVLFVCVRNAARSQMAEAFFNEMAKGRHLGVSAGSRPSNRINSDVVKVMAELGIDIRDMKPKKLTAEMVERADKVITMGCGDQVCPIIPKEIQDWRLEDPEGQPIEKIRQIRDQIRSRVKLLIETI